MFLPIIGFTLFIPGFPGNLEPKKEMEHWEKKLRDEAPKSWEKYEKLAQGFQGIWSYESRSLVTKSSIYSERGEIKQREDCFLFFWRSDKLWELSVVNSKYEFELRKRKEEGPWAVAGVGKFFFKPTSVEHPKNMASLHNRRSFTFTAIDGSWKGSLLDPGFAIKKVFSVMEDDQQLLKVEFDFLPPKEVVRMLPRKGFVLLDPSHYWVFHSFDVYLNFRNATINDKAFFYYDFKRNNFPILKKIVTRKKNPSQKVDVEAVTEFELQEKEIPEEEFRLSAFGFSEPQGVVWPKSRWYLWFIGIAVLSLVVGRYFWRRLERRLKDQGETHP